MKKVPRISVVTPSYNQGRFIAATIESVLQQQYPDVEHIVVDNMSTDETPQILSRYPHLKVVREPDQGQADAINKGFSLATGEIHCYLNSDDLLLPGALKRVAAEIRPAEGRHVVMGRCRFIDEEGRYIGIEHPSHFESFARVLAVWKGHFIPQPAVFWAARVWKECGPMRESLVLDYDLFCRFARRYRFHFIDQPLAAYRLHSESKTSRASDVARLEECIKISRQYWGSRLRPLYWRLALSLLWYRFNRHGRALRLLSHATRDWQRGRRLRGSAVALAGTLLAPEVAVNVALLPFLRFAIRQIGFPALHLRRPREYVQSLALIEHEEPWDDNWVGPKAKFLREARGGELTLIIQGATQLRHMLAPLVLTVYLDDERVHQETLSSSGHFCFSIGLPRPLEPGLHTISIHASAWWVPHRVDRSGDYRPLSWRCFGPESVLLR